ncbi:MAG: hypothetical protein WC683_10910 [bacterium]
MKKKIKHLSTSLPPVKLYADDIDFIVSNIKTVCSELKFSDSCNEYDSFDDLKLNNGSKIKEISICGRDKDCYAYIAVEVEKYGIYLYSNRDTPTFAGVWFALKDYLKRKSGWYSRFLNIWFWAFFSWVLLIILLTSSKASLKVTYLAYIVLSVSFFFLVMSALIKWKGSTVYLEKKYKILGFWEKNRDQVISLVSVGIIVALIESLLRFLPKVLSGE